MNVRLDQPTDRPDLLLRAATVAVLLVAGLGSLLVLRFALTGDPAERVTVTIDNPTDQPLRVDAVDADGVALDLGTVPAKGTTTVREVADIGASWTFVAHAANGETVRLPTLTHEQLEAQDWRVRIPPDAVPRPGGGPPGP